MKTERYIPVRLLGFKDCKYHFSYENEIYPYGKIVKREINGYIQKNLGDNNSGFLCKPCKLSLAFIPKDSEYRKLGDGRLVSNEVVIFKNIFTYLWFYLLYL